MKLFKENWQVLAVIAAIFIWAGIVQVWSISSLRSGLDTMRGEVLEQTRALQTQVESLKSTVAPLQKEVTALRQEITPLREQLAASGGQVGAPSPSSDGLGGRLWRAAIAQAEKVLQTQEDYDAFLKAYLAGMAQELGAATVQSGLGLVKLVGTSIYCNVRKESCGEGSEAAQAVQAIVDLTPVERQMQDIRTVILDQGRSIGAVETAVSELKTTTDEIAAGQAQLQKAAAETTSGLADAKAERGTLRTAMDELKTGFGKAGAEHDALKAELRDLTRAVREQTQPSPVAADTSRTFQVFFAKRGSFEGDWLRNEVEQVASDIKTFIGSRKGCAVSVQGHADTVGSDAVNLALSRKRAVAVTLLLQTMLPEAEIGEPDWAGERHLLVRTPDRTSERMNRRVDVFVRCGAAGARS